MIAKTKSPNGKINANVILFSIRKHRTREKLIICKGMTNFREKKKTNLNIKKF